MSIDTSAEPITRSTARAVKPAPAQASPAPAANAYVQWEPGISNAYSLDANPLLTRTVARVPNVADIKTPAASAWFQSAQVENLLDSRTQTPAAPATRIAILRDATHLFFAFECLEPSLATVHRLIPRDAANGSLRVFPDIMMRTLEHDDHVEVRIDTAHDHSKTLLLRVNINGARRADNVAATMSWAAVPVMHDIPAMPNLKWESEVHELADRWLCAIKVDLASIALDATLPAVGLHLGRARYKDCLQHFVSSPTLFAEYATPLAFNDLYLADTEVTVRNIAWPNKRTYDSNPLTLRVQNTGNARQVKLFAHLKGHVNATYETTATLAANETTPVTVTYNMPHNLENTTLVLDLQDTATGRSLYRSSLPMGNHSQLNVPWTPIDPASAPNPAPTDPDFHAKKLRYIRARLPKFVRRNTAQSAPSDFTLQSVDGKVTFNLMQAGVMQQIGRWVDSLFDNAIDRLVAAALFSNDDWITNHCTARVSMHNHLTALSALRLGAGHCYSRALAGAGIVINMTNPLTGKPFEAYPCLVVGHVVVAIRWRDGFTFIDPSYGHFFFNAANTDLATDIEIEQNHDLYKRVALRDDATCNYSRRDVHVRLEEGTIIWPQGAPPK